MNFQKIELYLSPSRINRYLRATGNNKAKAVRFYKANLKISQSFHPLLGILEVILRNRINTILTSYFSDLDWIINQKTGFMSDSSLTHTNRMTGRKTTNDFLKSSIEKSEQKLNRLHIPITSCKILSSQSFGFWTNFFDLPYYRILLGRPIQIFHNHPSMYGRSQICDRLNMIRQFRNRINHNEPICFAGNKIDFTYIEEIYKAILEILIWIDPELIKWIKNIDSITTAINKAKNI